MPSVIEELRRHRDVGLCAERAALWKTLNGIPAEEGATPLVIALYQRLWNIDHILNGAIYVSFGGGGGGGGVGGMSVGFAWAAGTADRRPSSAGANCHEPRFGTSAVSRGAGSRGVHYRRRRRDRVCNRADRWPDVMGGGAMTCEKCNDTGSVAVRSSTGTYAFAGPVPDDAKGFVDADCWFCGSGRPPPILPIYTLVERFMRRQPRFGTQYLASRGVEWRRRLGQSH